MIGGEAINNGTKYISNNKYSSFGNWAYNNSGVIKKLASNTRIEPYIETLFEFTNPGYYSTGLISKIKNKLTISKPRKDIFYKSFSNPENDLDDYRTKYIESLKRFSKFKNDKTPSTFTTQHPITKEDLSHVTLNNGNIITVTDDLMIDPYIQKYFDNITSKIAERQGWIDPYVKRNTRVAFYESPNSSWNGFY